MMAASPWVRIAATPQTAVPLQMMERASPIIPHRMISRLMKATA